MSDVGLGANLELDITAALRRVDQLGHAIEGAAAVTVQVDSSNVAPEITRAVDAANTGIIVEADTADVTGSIDGAVENANTAVIVTADAADVTGSIDGAVQAADTQVTVDGEISPALVSGSANLSANLADATENGGGLVKVLGLLSVTAAVGALRFLADAASDLAESTSKAAVVFGTEFDGIETFATDAATALGLSKQAAFEATGTFGNLFQALGTSREEAAKLAPEVVQLAGDLASFNNLSTDETLEKIRSGLVGEIEPLRSLGVSFNALQVEAKAVELGLGGIGRELTEGEKVQARYALIVEQTTLAQGDFARTSGGIANQQRILQAEFRNAAAAAGTALTPALLGLIDMARDDLIPQLGELAEGVLPALAEIITSLSPLLGSTLSVFVALAPVIEVVAAAIGLVPAPLISMAGTLLVVGKGLRLAGIGFDLLKTKAIAAGEGIAAANPLLLAATVALTAITFALGENADAQREQQALVDGVRQALADGTPTLEAYAKAVTAAADGNKDLTAGLLEAGVTASEFARAIASGQPGAINATNVSKGHVLALMDEAKALQEAAKQEVEAAVVAGDLTQAQVDTALAARTAADGTINYAGALDGLRSTMVRADEVTQQTLDHFGPLADSYLAGADALSTLAAASSEVALRTIAIREAADPSAESLVGLAQSITAAGLTEGEMGAAAAALGTDLESLTGFVDNVNGAIQGFVDKAAGGLPSIADAFRDANDDSKVSAREFIDGLAEDATELETFLADLNTIVGAGFAEVAGTLAEKGSEAAGLTAHELAEAARAGNDALLLETQAGIDDVQAATADSTAYFRDVLGPEFVAANGAAARAATEAFGAEFSPAEQARIQMALTASGLEGDGLRVAAIAATVGGDAARAFGETLELDREAIDAAVRAGVAIAGDDTVPVAFYNQGRDAGTQFGVGIGVGIANAQPFVDDKVLQMVQRTRAAAAAAAQEGSPSKLFATLGVNIALGVAQGIDQAGAAVVAAAERIVQDAAAVGIAQVSPEVSMAARAGGGQSGGPEEGGLSVTFGPGSVVVHAAPGVSPQEARDLGAALIDGAAERMAERRLSMLARTL